LTRSDIPGEVWSLDRFFLRHWTLGGFHSFLLAVDDASSLVKVWLLKRSLADDQLTCLRALCNWVLTQVGRRIKKFRTDGEWCSKSFLNFQLEWGFELFKTNRGNPNSNAIAERHGGIILSKARAMMVAAQAPAFLFGEAINYAVYVHNRTCKIHTPSNYSPVFKFHRSFTSSNAQATSADYTVHQLRVFGCVCVFRVDWRKPSKEEARGIKGIFVGCDTPTRSWRIYVPEEKSIHTSRDVIFDESNLWYKKAGSTGTTPTPPSYSVDDFCKISDTAEKDSEISFQTSTDSGNETSTHHHLLDSGQSNNTSSPLCIDDAFREVSDNGGKNSDTSLPTSAQRGRETSPHHHSSDSARDNATKVEAIPMDVPDDDSELESAEPVNGMDQGTSTVVGTPSTNDALDYIVNIAQCYFTPAVVTDEEASNSADWRGAEERELESLKRLRVFSLVPRRVGVKVIETKWVRTIKPAEKAQGDPVFKARLVAKGFQQVFGTNYFDTWAPTTNINAIRILASLPQVIKKSTTSM